MKSEEQLTRRTRIVRFATHLICIGMLFVLPELANMYGHRQPTPASLQVAMYCKALVFVAVFYVNYYFVIGRSFEHPERQWRLLAWNLLVFAGAILLLVLLGAWQHQMWLQAATAAGREPHHTGFFMPWGMMWRFLSHDLVMLVLTVALSVALKMGDTWTLMSQRARQAQDLHRQEELANLKNQLNPHFLFNTLNSIYALIEVSPSTAQQAVHELSRMLRYVLYDDSPQVALSAEADFLRNYLALMSLRLASPKVLQAKIDVEAAAQKPIAPLLFIPLVENAFKYGNNGSADTRIAISLTATPDGTVICTTSNPMPAESAVPKSPTPGGIGLQNLRRRLELLYGSNATLRTEVADGRYLASLTIHLTPQK